MDMDIEELRDLIKKNMELTQENNRILRGMRSSARWGRFFSIVWWLIIIAASGVTYLYLQPYILQAEKLYSQLGQSNQQAQDYGKQFSNFLEQFKAPQQ